MIRGNPFLVRKAVSPAPFPKELHIVAALPLHISRFMALRLSARLTGLPEEESQWGEQLLRNFGYAVRLPRLDREAVLAALTRDKKRLEAGLVFVLLRRLGEAVIQEDVPLALAGEALSEVLEGSK